MQRTKSLRAGLLTCAALALLASTVSCKATRHQVQPDYPQVTATGNVVPYIPPQYYSCMEVASLDDLLGAFFADYGNLAQAEQTLDGQAFVFNSVGIFSPSMLVNGDTFQMGNAIFTAMVPGSVGKLKVGQLIDIVGVLLGPMPEAEGTPIASWFNDDGTPIRYIVPGWLHFTGCIFLPSGSVLLPAPGAPEFTPLY